MLTGAGQRMAIVDVLKCHEIDVFTMRLAERGAGSPGYAVFRRRGNISGNLDVPAFTGSFLGDGLWNINVVHLRQV